MKKTIYKSLLVAGVLATLASCSEDSWNNGLDGFTVPDHNRASTETVECTLTASDYKKIASYAANKEWAEANGQSDALAAIGTNACFQNAQEARQYIPAFLRDSTLTYFALNNGASVNVNYDLAENLPEIVKDINANCQTYSVSEEDYVKAWGSDTDYIPSFAPMTPASKNMAAILAQAFPDAKANDYVVATYNVSTENPEFSQAEPETPAFEATSVLNADIALKADLEVKGWVAAIDARGFVVADNAGSLLVYQEKDFDVTALAVGDQMSVAGTVGSYNNGFQLSVGDGAVWEKIGTGGFSYPAPKSYTAAEWDALVAEKVNRRAEYVSVKAKASITTNDKGSTYYNFLVDGATCQGSGYQLTEEQKGWFENGKTYDIQAYFVSTSSGRFFNIVPVAVKEAVAGAPMHRLAARIPAADVTYAPENAIYVFNGSDWKTAQAIVLQNADYTAMGQTYGNLSNDGPDIYLPVFLKNKYPYASQDQVATVAYKYYSGTTKYQAAQFTFDGSEWVRNNGQSSDKFTKINGYWGYNPSVEITLPYSRNTDPSYSYYMACVEYVLENVVKPIQPDATLTTCEYYVDYRGNAEFYSGASAYYGNVDIRATTAKNNAPEDAYSGMSDDQIILLLKKRFSTETLPYALRKMNPDASPEPGMDITYTVYFTAYGAETTQENVVYRVTSVGHFEYVSSSWVESGEDSGWTVKE